MGARRGAGGAHLRHRASSTRQLSATSLICCRLVLSRRPISRMAHHLSGLPLAASAPVPRGCSTATRMPVMNRACHQARHDHPRQRQESMDSRASVRAGRITTPRKHVRRAVVGRGVAATAHGHGRVGHKRAMADRLRGNRNANGGTASGEQRTLASGGDGGECGACLGFDIVSLSTAAFAGLPARLILYA